MESKRWSRDKNDKADNPEIVYLLDEKRDESTSNRNLKKASNKRKFCVIVSCIMQFVVCGGIGYGLSVMYAEIITVFNTERRDAALIQSFNMGIASASGILFNGVIKKFGPGVCIILGALISTLGLFASAFAENLASIIVCTGIITGTGMGICQLCAYLTVSWMFHKDAGLFLIILTTGLSFGQLIVPNLCESFISNYTWSGAFILLAAVSVQLVPFGLVIHLSGDYFVFGSVRSKQDKCREWCDISLYTDVVVWIFWINALLLALTGNVEPWFMVDHMIGRGYSRKDGAFSLSGMGVGNFFGKVIGAILKLRCSRILTVFHWIYLGLLLAGLHILIISLKQFTAIFVSCCLFGCTVGLMFSQAPAIMYEASGLDRYPQACAMMNVMYGIGDVIGPILGGYIKDTYGVYDIAFFIACAASVYMSLSSSVAVYYTKKEACNIQNAQTF